MELGDRGHRADTAIEELGELAARIRAGDRVQMAEVDRALCHSAVSLIAEQASCRAAIEGAPPTVGAAGCPDRVARLSRVMAELRELTRPPGTLTTWAEHGFVLPAARGLFGSHGPPTRLRPLP